MHKAKGERSTLDLQLSAGAGDVERLPIWQSDVLYKSAFICLRKNRKSAQMNNLFVQLKRVRKVLFFFQNIFSPNALV